MAFRVFEIRKRSSRFAYVMETPEWLARNPPTVFDGRPKGAGWRPPPVYVLHPLRDPWDTCLFPGSQGLLLTPRASAALRGFFEWGGVELLPLLHEGQIFTAVNILEVPNCLDASASRRRPSGSIEHYAFHPKRFTRSLFKLPEEVLGPLCVAEDDRRPEWSFKTQVDRLGLTGVEFHLVWEGE